MTENARTVTEPVIRIEGLGKSFDGHPVVDDVTIDIRRGEIFVILGASGCGKTMLIASPTPFVDAFVKRAEQVYGAR